jgi:hypothetical protein
MTEDQKDLARRFVACKHWRWMPGMLARYSEGKSWYRLTEADSYGIGPNCRPPDRRTAWPDLADPATLGCILALVRDATGDRRIHCRVRANVYRVYSGVSPIGPWMESEEEALLLALEAA